MEYGFDFCESLYRMAGQVINEPINNSLSVTISTDTEKNSLISSLNEDRQLLGKGVYSGQSTKGPPTHQGLREGEENV